MCVRAPKFASYWPKQSAPFASEHWQHASVVLSHKSPSNLTSSFRHDFNSSTQNIISSDAKKKKINQTAAAVQTVKDIWSFCRLILSVRCPPRSRYIHLMYLLSHLHQTKATLQHWNWYARYYSRATLDLVFDFVSSFLLPTWKFCVRVLQFVLLKFLNVQSKKKSSSCPTAPGQGRR